MAENSAIAIKPVPSGDYPAPLLRSFPDITPSALLSKKFLLDEFQVTSADATYSRTWYLPAAFNTQRQLALALSTVRFFRANGIRLTFIIQHSFTVSGLAMVGHVPSTISTFMDEYRLSGYPSQMVSYSASSEVIFPIKNFNPEPWIDVSYSPAGAIDFGNEYGFVQWINLFPIRSYEGTADVVDVKVYGEFIDPLTAGPTAPKSVCAAAPQSRLSRRSFVTQSEPSPTSKTTIPFDWESFDKSSTGSMLSNAIAPLLDPIINTVGEVLPLATSILGVLDKPNSQRITQNVTRIDTQDWNLANGVDNVQRLGLYSRSTKAHHGYQFTPMSNLSMNDIASKPMLLHTASLNFATTGFEFTEFDHHPCPVYVTSMDAGVSQPDYFSSISSMHRFVRPSYKYLVYFACTNLMRGKAQISLLFDGDLPSIGNTITKIVDIRGDTITQFSIPYLLKQQYQNPVTRAANTATIRIDLITTPVGVNDSAFDPTVDVAVFRSAGPGSVFNGLKQSEISPGVFEAQCDFQEAFKKPFEPIVPCTFSYENGYIAAEQVGTVNDVLRRRHIFQGVNMDGMQGGALINPIDFYRTASHGWPSAAQLPHFRTPWAWFFTASQFWSGDLDYKLQTRIPVEVAASITPFGNTGGGLYRWEVPTLDANNFYGSANSYFKHNNYNFPAAATAIALQIPFYSLSPVESSITDQPAASDPGDTYQTLALDLDTAQGLTTSIHEHGISAADNFRLYNLRPFARLTIQPASVLTKTEAPTSKTACKPCMAVPSSSRTFKSKDTQINSDT